MPSAEYYLKQAETASRLALTESEPAKMRALHLLALQFFDKAERAKAGEYPPAPTLTGQGQSQQKKEIRRRD
jgi:hypothetical protein